MQYHCLSREIKVGRYYLQNMGEAHLQISNPNDFLLCLYFRYAIERSEDIRVLCLYFIARVMLRYSVELKPLSFIGGLVARLNSHLAISELCQILSLLKISLIHASSAKRIVRVELVDVIMKILQNENLRRKAINEVKCFFFSCLSVISPSLFL